MGGGEIVGGEGGEGGGVDAASTGSGGELDGVRGDVSSEVVGAVVGVVRDATGGGCSGSSMDPAATAGDSICISFSIPSNVSFIGGITASIAASATFTGAVADEVSVEAAVLVLMVAARIAEASCPAAVGTTSVFSSNAFLISLMILRLRQGSNINRLVSSSTTLKPMSPNVTHVLFRLMVSLHTCSS